MDLHFNIIHMTVVLSSTLSKDAESVLNHFASTKHPFFILKNS